MKKLVFALALVAAIPSFALSICHPCHPVHAAARARHHSRPAPVRVVHRPAPRPIPRPHYGPLRPVPHYEWHRHYYGWHPIPLWMYPVLIHPRTTVVKETVYVPVATNVTESVEIVVP